MAFHRGNYSARKPTWLYDTRRDMQAVLRTACTIRRKHCRAAEAYCPVPMLRSCDITKRRGRPQYRHRVSHWSSRVSTVGRSSTLHPHQLMKMETATKLHDPEGYPFCPSANRNVSVA